MNDHRVEDARDGLSQIGTVLTSISTMIAALAPAANAQAQVTTARQRELSATQESIEVAVRAVEAGQHQPGHHFHVANVAPGVESFNLEHAVVHPHHPLGVIVDVRASAQWGGLLLSCGQFGLASLTLRVTGVRGTAEVTVGPWVHAWTLSDAIQSVSQLTGVTAYYIGTDVHLASQEPGSDQFVAVQIMSPNHDNGPTGIYRMLPDDAFTPDPASRIPFESAEAHAGVWDYGQDIEATVNGRIAEGHGTWLQLWSPQLRLDVTLSEHSWYHAFQLGPFRAFEIIRD